MVGGASARAAVATVGVSVTAALAVVAAAPGAHAAEVIGQTGTPVVCAAPNAFTQRTLSGPFIYAASTDGVITSWSTMADATAGNRAKLLVLRPVVVGPPPSFAAVQKDELRALTPSTLNTFAVRIPIAAGSQLGLFIPGGQPGGVGVCAFATGVAGDILTSNDPPGEPAIGVTETYSSTTGNVRLNASAVVEPDADNDGFGDETQDCAPADPAKAADCAPPETQITKGPKDKTKKKKATLEFASEPGATFECSLNGAAFAPCSSPLEIKGKKGNNSFQVRATDAAGNVDPSPATDDWKVKKKKK